MQGQTACAKTAVKAVLHRHNGSYLPGFRSFQFCEHLTRRSQQHKQEQLRRSDSTTLLQCVHHGHWAVQGAQKDARSSSSSPTSDDCLQNAMGAPSAGAAIRRRLSRTTLTCSTAVLRLCMLQESAGVRLWGSWTFIAAAALGGWSSSTSNVLQASTFVHTACWRDAVLQEEAETT